MNKEEFIRAISNEISMAIGKPGSPQMTHELRAAQLIVTYIDEQVSLVAVNQAANEVEPYQLKREERAAALMIHGGLSAPLAYHHAMDLPDALFATLIDRLIAGELFAVVSNELFRQYHQTSNDGKAVKREMTYEQAHQIVSQFRNGLLGKNDDLFAALGVILEYAWRYTDTRD